MLKLKRGFNEVKSSLHVENATQANLWFAALSLALFHGERGWGCRLLLRFRQFLTLVEAVLSEAPFSDDLLEYHRHTHRAAESKIQTDGSPHSSLCSKQQGYGNPSPLPVGEG
ncbi:hypothetical protein [Neisseria meningitidis]|uniref:hypothetical protein n=1 Tax=Neisseria meningitidis TaxID=487 RepID=UPI000662959A|nr:hypothetical protein [Neisseria meningitidis]